MHLKIASSKDKYKNVLMWRKNGAEIIYQKLYLSNLRSSSFHAWHGYSEICDFTGIAGGIIVGFVAEKFAMKKLHLLLVAMGATLLPISLAMLLNVTPKIVYVVLNISCMIVFIMASIAGILLMSAIQKEIPADMIGRVMSLYFTMASCALPIGMSLYGIVFDYFSGSLYLVLLITSFMIMAVGFVGKRVYSKFDKKSETIKI